MTTKKLIPFGIDLGTTNTCGAVWWNEKPETVANEFSSRTTPSYHYFDGIESYVGKTAKEKTGTKPKNVFYDSKRILAQKSNDQLIKKFKSDWTFEIKANRAKNNLCEYIVSPEMKPLPSISVSGEILKSIKESAKRRFGQEIEQTVITVPAYFTTEQKKATLEAAKYANLSVIRIITEPTAAAIAYALEHKYKDGEKVFVFDLGGGTFDVTIMQISKQKYKSLIVRGDFHLGGRDFDHLIFEWMKKKLILDIGKEAENLHQKRKFKMMLLAQAYKEALSVSEEVPIILSDIFDTAKSHTLKRSEFEEMSKHLLEKIQTECKMALQYAEVKAQEIDHVLFVGGSSRMPMIAKMLTAMFGEGKMSKVVNPDEVVAVGAAMYAASQLKASNRPEILGLDVQEVISLNIGIEIAGGKFKAILKAPSQIPCENSYTLVTSVDNQRAASIPLYEGLDEDDDISKYKCIAEIIVPELPLGKAGTIKANLKLSLQMNGMLNAVATIKDMIIPINIQYNTPWDLNN